MVEELVGLVKPDRVEGGSRSQQPGREPLLSVVVVVFRDRDELANILANLAEFRDEDIEVVVVDGGSQDGSVDVLRAQDQTIDYWLSERDEGMYDAMNKAIAAARGRFILHINAGDRLLKVPRDLLQKYADRADVICCRVAEPGRKLWSPGNRLLMRFKKIWHHQGTFYRRERHLGYDTQYRVAGDWDLDQRMLLSGCRVRISQEIVASHEKGGLSAGAFVYREDLKLIRHNYGALSAQLARCLYYASYQYWRLRTILSRKLA